MATRPKSINRREVARNNCNHLGNVMVKTQQFLSGTKEIIKNALFTVRLTVRVDPSPPPPPPHGQLFGLFVEQYQTLVGLIGGGWNGWGKLQSEPRAAHVFFIFQIKKELIIFIFQIKSISK